MTDLEQALRGLDVEWPETPDIAAAVSARLEPRRARRPWFHGWRRRFAFGLAALALLFGGTMAVSPSARTDVLRWLGLKSVEIKREPPRPRPRAGVGLGLGDRTTVEALRRAGYPLRVPKGLGEPDAYATTLPAGTKAASLVYPGPVLVQTFRAQVEPFIEKTVHMADQVQRLTVDGKPAYFIRGAHGFAYQSGRENVGFEDQRIAGNTLLVEGDGVLLRIEGSLSRERAVEIARSARLGQ